MATSGTFTGGRGGGSTGPWLTLAWSRIETDIPDNRSKIRLTLRLHSDFAINFSASKTGVLHGQSFTFAGGFTGTGSKVLRTRDVWINHNPDGSKTQSFSASFNIAVAWSGSTLSNLSVSGNAVIDPIPRASGFTAFSLANTTLNVSTANTVTYTLDRKNSSFSHIMTLKLGGTTIKSWTDSGTGDRTNTLSTTQVNSIINGRPNHVDGTLTLTMQTRSGSTNIGSSVSRTRYFGLSPSIVPNVSGLSAIIAGSGRDKDINRFVQTITRVYASFTRSAGFGASMANSSILVVRTSGADPQTISGNAGSTANPLKWNGEYEVIATARDTRGRTSTIRTTFISQPYYVPRINTFRGSRKSDTSTTVDMDLSVSYSPLDTLNPASIKLVGVDNSGINTVHRDDTGQTDGSINVTQSVLGQSDASSYTYTLTVTDSFGKKSTAVIRIGTSFVELTISKGKGIGVGKVHERGAIDAAGDIYSMGFLTDNIVSTGTNSTGRWIRYSSGWQIITLSVEMDLSISTLQAYPLPADFVGYVSGSVTTGSMNGTYEKALSSIYISVPYQGNFGLRISSDAIRSSQVIISARLFAIGKWE